MSRRRLDTELVRRGLAESRTRARALIDDGRVTVAGAIAYKAGRMVAPAEPVEVLGPPPRFVGRGGEKLAAALDRFRIDVTGVRALDAGSSTGGFTDCLLQAGAAEVIAVDVGRNQLHERLRGDPRVVVRERTDIRDVDLGLLGGRPVDLVTGDLSFISLRTVLDALVAVSAPGAEWLLLVKPQFEAGRAEASRGRGVITDPAVWRRVLSEVADATTAAGVGMMGAMVSPIRGAQGNVEFVVRARVGEAPVAGLDELLDAVVAAATAPDGG